MSYNSLILISRQFSSKWHTNHWNPTEIDRNRSSIMSSYFKNDADQAAVVGIPFWNFFRNYETILGKMMWEWLIWLKKRDSTDFVYSMVCTQSFTQKTLLSLYFWQILTVRTRELSHCLTILIFYFKKIEIWKEQINWRCLQTLASVWSIFFEFQWFACHFDKKSLTTSNIFKIKIRLA